MAVARTEAEAPDRLVIAPYQEGEIPEPPRTRREFWRMIGPGIVYAAATIGTGELVLTATAGARYGYLLMWTVFLCCILKYFHTDACGRYTLATGGYLTEGWYRIGRLGQFLVAAYFVFHMIEWLPAMSAYASTTGTALYGLLGGLSFQWWGALALVVSIAFMLKGRYDWLERIMTVLLIVFLLGILTVSIMVFPENPGALFQWGIPRDTQGILVMMGLIGFIGFGYESTYYTYWFHEKVFRRPGVKVSTVVAPFVPTPTNVERFKQWEKLLRADLLILWICVAVFSAAMIIDGAEVLKPRGVTLGGARLVIEMSKIFTETFGSWSGWLFMLGAFATLYTTLLGETSGMPWAAQDTLRLLLKRGRMGMDSPWFKIFCVSLLLSLIFVFGIPQPQWLVIAASGIGALSLPFQTLGAYLAIRSLPKEYHPGPVTMWGMVVATIVFLAFAVAAIYDLLT